MKSPLLRRLLIGLAVLALLFGSAAAWLIASFDAERAKGLAIDWMKEHRNRTLAIAGPLELALLPRLQVRVSQLRLSEPGSAAEFASLDEAAFSVALLPLLSKSLVIDAVSARGLRLAYTRNAQGVSNIDDLLGAGAPATPDRKEPKARADAALRFDVSRVELKDLRARVQDALAGVKGEITLESLVSGRLADQTESPLKLQAQLALESPAVRGALSGETRIALDLGGHGVALREMALAFKGDAAGARGVDATLKGALAWNSAQGTLRAEGLTLEGGATLGALTLAGSSLALQQFAFDPEAQRLNIARLALRLHGTASGSPLTLALDWPQLDVRGQALQGSALSGSLALEGETRLAGTFKSAPPRGDFEQLTVPGFEARWTGAGASRKISGTLASELTVRPAMGSLAFGKVELDVQLQGAAAKPLPIGLRGSAEVSPSQARWAFDGQIAGKAFTTRGDAEFSGIVPAVQAQARFDALDLDALLPPPAHASPAAAQAGAEAPLDLSPLRRVNGRFELHAGRIAQRSLQARDVVFEATLDGGKLRVGTLRGQVWGGSVDASGQADAHTGRVALKALASDVNIGALERAITGRDVLEGTGRIALDVQSVGRTASELKSHLQGTAQVQLRDGAVKGINLARSLRQARSALTLKKDARFDSAQTEKTDFSELSVSFRLDDGVARSTDLDLKSPFLRIGGAGAIDLGKGHIDYTARATVVTVPAGQDGAELAALKGLTVPVHLSGPLDAIEWRIEWSTLAAAAAQNQLKALLERGLKPASPGASGASAPASANPRKELAERLLKGLFK